MSVFNASVLLLTMNFVITFSKSVMTKFMINHRTDARKTDFNLFII